MSDCWKKQIATYRVAQIRMHLSCLLVATVHLIIAHLSSPFFYSKRSSYIS